MKKTKQISSEQLSMLVIEGMLEKKALKVLRMDLRNIKNAITDYFVICSGTSDTQLDAIADSVEETIQKKSGEKPWHREGKTNREWILLDYSDVVIHIFKSEKRDFYDIESLWGDASFTYFGEDMKPSNTPL